MTISRCILLRMKNVLDKRCRENQNTHYMFSNFFQKSRRLWDNVEKCGGVRETTNENKIWRMRVAKQHASPRTCSRPRARAPTRTPPLLFPRARARAHPHRHKYTYCLSTARIPSRTHLDITLYIHCLSFSCFLLCLKSVHSTRRVNTFFTATKTTPKLFHTSLQSENQQNKLFWMHQCFSCETQI